MARAGAVSAKPFGKYFSIDLQYLKKKEEGRNSRERKKERIRKNENKIRDTPIVSCIMERNHEMEGREGGSKRNRDGRSLSFDERLDPAQQSFPRSEGSPVFALSFLFKYFSFFFLS